MRAIGWLVLLLPCTGLALDPMPGEDRFSGLLDMKEQSAGAGGTCVAGFTRRVFKARSKNPSRQA